MEISLAEKIVHGLLLRGVRIKVVGGRIRMTPRELVRDADIAIVRARKAAIIDLLTAAPPPTGDDWIRGRVTLEAAGMDRWASGGRPQHLRADLRQLWLDTYTESLQIMSEPKAWDAAWDAIDMKEHRA